MQQKSIVAVLVALIVVLAGTTIYFAVSKNAYAPSASQPVPAQSLAGKIPATTSQQANNNQEPVYNPQNLDIKPLDSEWNTYTSKKFGFSVNIPKKIYKGKAELGVDKNCSGYRPVTAFENSTAVFVASDYGISPGFSGDNCNKQTFDYLKSNFKEDNKDNIDGLILNIFSVPTESDLSNVVKQVYGCKTSVSKKPSSQQDTYDVSVTPAEDCWMNFTYVFKYSPRL